MAEGSRKPKSEDKKLHDALSKRDVEHLFRRAEGITPDEWEKERLKRGENPNLVHKMRKDRERELWEQEVRDRLEHAERMHRSYEIMRGGQQGGGQG